MAGGSKNGSGRWRALRRRQAWSRIAAELAVTGKNAALRRRVFVCGEKTSGHRTGRIRPAQTTVNIRQYWNDEIRPPFDPNRVLENQNGKSESDKCVGDLGGARGCDSRDGATCRRRRVPWRWGRRPSRRRGRRGAPR